MARDSVSGDRPPEQVGLPLLQLSTTPWSLIFQAIGSASWLQTASSMRVPPATIASRLPPARAGPTPADRLVRSRARRTVEHRRPDPPRPTGATARRIFTVLSPTNPGAGRPDACGSLRRTG